ncbi:hypothetical protein Q9L58_005460 [Maublancomyces gigas]|uniref:PUM-HD domain-containing protein n=1 Tax=Discina gigas TaxID=1032678 RepID=A0ABR3GHW1_9PEZI
MMRRSVVQQRNNWFKLALILSSIVHLRCCWQALRSCRHSSPWLLRSSTLYRPCLWKAKDSIDPADYSSCDTTRPRPLRKLRFDLNETQFSEPLILQFRGRVCELSKQKFSSNVIEKCIRVASPQSKKILLEEMMNQTELEKLLRDSYANYVIQTAIEYSEPHIKQQLVDSIRPILPAIRMTPYGRRIQQKIQTTGSPNGIVFANAGPSTGHPQSHSQPPSRSNSYSQPSVRPTPVQQQSYPGPFIDGSQYYLH